MSSAKLVFQFPEDEQDFLLAANARKLLIGIEEVDQACRNVIKYHESPSEDTLRLAEEVRRILAEAAGEYL